jgi:hypothetical protein
MRGIPRELNYLALRLKAGEGWRDPTALGHTVGWVSVSVGRLQVPDSVDAGELAVFDSSDAAIDLRASVDAEFVIGSAVPHAHDLVLGSHSVHTSLAALRASEQRLGEIRTRLRKEGRL